MLLLAVHSLCASLIPTALADEGMWLPEQVQAMGPMLRQQGLQIDAARLADPTGDPLGAVVSLGNCTAAFISADGLIGTNGHCVSSYLEFASDAQHPYARDGFVARDRTKELWAGPSARIWVTEKIEDVTAQITSKFTAKMKDSDRQGAIDAASKALVSACEKAAKPAGTEKCMVAPFYDGREYRLITRLEIKDVRVAYVPADAVYEFGGDQDNWMWPRQCGDFALLRAYVAPDGTPVAHADGNVPYHPPRHLSVQPAGVHPGDFVMIAGYPGTTYRYRTALEAQQAVTVRYPEGITFLNALLSTAKGFAHADADAATRLQQTIANLANARKSYEGMLNNFLAAHIVDRKEALEKDLDAWIAADPARTAKYAASITELRTVLTVDLSTFRRDRLYNGLSYTSKPLNVALTSYRYASEHEKADSARDVGFQDRDLADIQDRFTAMDKGFHAASDRAMLKVILDMTQQLAADQRIPPLDAWITKAGGVDKALDALYASTSLNATDGRLKLLHTSKKELDASTDPWVVLAASLEKWQQGVRATNKAQDGALARLRPVYMDALRDYHAGQLYPDANGTLRLSFGRVQGYSPQDGVTYNAQTVLSGLVRKAGDAPFDAPARLLDHAKTAASSRYADGVLHDVPVDFLTTLDNTGGSSGSPTLNAQGELVGFVFDRNWDAVAADWIYDKDSTRSIHADVRYLLWLLSEVDGGDALVKEMVPS